MTDASDDAYAEIEVPELCSEGREGHPENGEDSTHDDERASASVRLKMDPNKTVARDELMRLHGDETVHFSVMRYDDPGSKLPTGKVTFSCPGTWEVLLSYRHIEMTLATAQTFKSYLKRQAPSEASTPLMEQWRFLGFYTAVPVTVSLAFESDQGLRSSP